ncbi:hypothetical protein CR155_14995 [Pollutimonas nitritireducens]|uniref:DUF2946 domain-containing protein n=1 Tax=Pollutimonas nitritireducens TaxID=2045209 RepID=A0A2N4UDL6_9BURK|nr:DUF2946 domain-containing protein [Pollutimonas nitritireducens]PLC53104.1 hypothetical protein CR155_14995 [Pollutimonas nitritireducens]
MKRSRYHRYSACLALLAMLMIFLAPVISQSLAVAQVPATHHTAASNHAQGDPAPAAGEHPDHDLDQCGYCTQLPTLSSSSGQFLDTALPRRGSLRQGVCNRRTIKAGFPDALPRAPPFLFGNDENPPGA